MNPPPRRPLIWWDVAVTAVLVLLGGIVVIEGLDGQPGWAAERTPAVRLTLLTLPLLLIGIHYLALGRRVLRLGADGCDPGGQGGLFLTLLVLLLALAVFASPIQAVLQVLVYPMIWSVVIRYRDAVLWSAAAALAVGVSMFFGLHLAASPAAWSSAALSAPISFVFAVAMGTWITRIAAQGERYRALAETLRDSQQKVAALSETAGAAAERERLSRELHDTLTQTLTGLVMLSEQAERALAAGETDRAADRLARVSAASREAMQEARALVATMQPLADGGLAQSIERVAERLRRDTGMRVNCEFDIPPLERELEVVLLRATQEGLANARRHSRASAVDVSLRAAEPGEVVLRIVDDGVGPDPDGSDAAGFGLRGLSDRVRGAGGRMSFGAGAGRGAVLEVRVPITGATAQGVES